MKYPDKIYICRNMMCADVDSLINNKRVIDPYLTCTDFENGKCCYDNHKCALVEYQKVKK